MKMAFIPTLSEMREMLGEELYVAFVWMWREQDQNARALERRAKYAAVVPQRQSVSWPTPVFARVSESGPVAVPPFQAAALLRAQPFGRGIETGETQGERAPDIPREAAMAGGRRARR